MSEEINKECPLCLGTGYAYQELGLKSDGSNCVLCSGTGVLSHSAKYAKLRSQLTNFEFDLSECKYIIGNPSS